MEELLEIKHLIQSGKYDDALLLVEDLEEMGRKGLKSNIRSYAKILLLHLIKQQVEQRTTNSWDDSIENSVDEIKYMNQRERGGGNYISDEELSEIVSSAWKGAVKKAASEIFGGKYEFRQVEQMVERDRVIREALQLIRST